MPGRGGGSGVASPGVGDRWGPDSVSALCCFSLIYEHRENVVHPLSIVDSMSVSHVSFWLR